MPGHVLLKKGATTVRTINLSQTGEINFMFDQYAPADHRITWEMDKDAPTPPLEFIFRTGQNARKIHGAIYVRKVEHPLGP